MEKIRCDICNSKMAGERKRTAFLLQGETYHGEALIYHCNICGYEKLGTCEVKFWENDVPPKRIEDELTGTKKKVPRPKMFEMKHGKAQVSDDWLDWMLENKQWFIPLYDKFIPKHRQEMRYLSKQAPAYKAILNNVLYDTENSKMFLMDEKDYGSEMCRKYYYMTQSGKYFAVVVQFGKVNELITMELKEVKKLLAQKPDLYREVIPEEVLE